MATHRHRSGGFPIARIVAAVIGVHVLGGLGFLFLAKTQAGQQLAKQYNIKLFTPPKPPEQAKQEPPPPPPPPPRTKDAAPPPPSASSAPKMASAAPPPSAAPMIGGGGGAPNWAGGKFLGSGLGDGPEGAYRASTIAKFRGCFKDNMAEMGGGELRLAIDRQGAVKGFKLATSTGNTELDQEALRCAGELQRTGLGPPPADKGAIVTVRLYPSY
jgi:outer membrane biosynthesis protein TonB